MWSPSLFFISNRFYKTQNNLGPFHDHIITEFSWFVIMAPAVSSTDILRWPVPSQWPSSRRLKLWRICYIRQHNINPRALQIWTSGEDGSDRILWLVLDAISCVTWLIYRSHRKEGRGSNFLIAFTCSGQSNSKLYVQKNNYVPNYPVELAQYSMSCLRIRKILHPDSKLYLPHG